MSIDKNRHISLTGIKPTGTPHLGNYVGAIKPALQLIDESAVALYFIADYHALTLIHDPKLLDQLIYEVAATWLAFGLDTDKVVFYRQSDLPEVFELSWILGCMTAKGLMNRAHAYKAAIAQNEAAGNADLDAGINMGLYHYPVLMAADILLFDADIVPVGKDQVQHVEIARDIAQHFNHTFGETLVLPNARLQATAAAIPGLDGRKMSKSYGNTIPLFSDRDKLRKLLFKFVTDSSSPAEPKDPATSPLFALYREFASDDQTEAMRQRFAAGIGWGTVKQELFEVMDAFLTEPRQRYTELLHDRRQIDALLAAGAKRARELAHPTMDRVRRAIGARS